MVAISSVIAGCGDTDDAEGNGSASTATISGGAGSGSSGSTGGITLSVNGTPPSQIIAGTPFSFRPTVSNPHGVALTFSASNLPRWAAISPSTGHVTGTPGAGDIGTYTNIRLTVSGGGTSDSTPTFSVEVVAVASGAATVSWVPPTEYTDGSPLTNLSGYRIYYGQSQNNLNQTVTIANPGITTYVIENLTAATWYFAATAYDSSGLESRLSNVAAKTIL